MTFLYGLIILFLVCFQGGFYPQTYLIAGIVAGICVLIKLFVQKNEVKITYELAGTFLLSAVYLISMLVSGMAYSTLSAAILPIVMFELVIMLCFINEHEKEKIRLFLTWFGLISSVIAIFIFVGLVNVDGTIMDGRVLFTFQYANAAGIWFDVCFIMAILSDNKYARYFSPVCLAALLCTKSAGAILALLIVGSIHLFRSDVLKKFSKKNQIIILVLYVSGAVLGVLFIALKRSSSLQTFVERFVQSYDGLKGIVYGNLMGVGPGNWQYVLGRYQSAQYQTTVIHNSYVQAGVDAGVIALIIMALFFVLAVKKYLKNPSSANLVVFVIMLHSVVDYDLRFSSIGCILVLFASFEPAEITVKMPRKSLNRYAGCALSVFVIALCIVSFNGVMKIRSLEAAAYNGDLLGTDKIYEDNSIMMKNGYRENEAVGVLRCKNGTRTADITVCSDRLRMYKLITDDRAEIGEIISLMEDCPFSTRIHRNTKEMVYSDRFTEEEQKLYRETLDKINEKFDKWPADMLINQYKY